jgi:uncharacterized protein YjbI with pentapeptide repeats
MTFKTIFGRTAFLAATLALFLTATSEARAACEDPADAGVDWSGCDKSHLNLSGHSDNANAESTATSADQATNEGGLQLTYPGVYVDEPDAFPDIAILSGADLTGTNLTGANLSGVQLVDANLTNADLTNADLSGGSLSNANLTNANLTRADLEFANLRNANLSGAILSNAKLSNAAWTDGRRCAEGSVGACN